MLNSFEEFKNGEIPEKVVVNDKGKIKEVKITESVWERARKIFDENTDTGVIVDFIESDSATETTIIGE